MKLPCSSGHCHTYIEHFYFLFFKVGPKGQVVGIDHIKELVDDSINNVKKDDPAFLSSGRVKLLGKWHIVCAHQVRGNRFRVGKRNSSSFSL